MTTLYIIIAVVAALLGATIMYFVRKPNKKDYDENSKVVAKLEAELKTQTTSLKEKYEALLSDSKNQIEDLNIKLASALEGKVDEVTKDALAQVDSLKKKIKDLEDELEESEDDLADAKKRLKRKDEESSAIQDSLSNCEREIKGLRQNIEVLNIDLTKTQKELELKVQSLSFVQEVLSAPEARDDQTRMLFERVSEVVEFIEGDLRDHVKEIYEITPELDNEAFGDGLYNWAARAKKSWIAGKTAIAFVGEFSAGKTSIVNRILSQDNPDVPLLPVSTKATTAIPTYISGAAGPIYQFVSPDNNLKSLSESTFRKVSKEVLDQIHGVSSLIKYFVMGYKNSNLDTLSILDTPGFNSNDPEDANRTIEVINECDALFWVIDVNAGNVNQSSLNLIRDNLTKPLYIVINKVDTKPHSEVDKVEELIRTTLADAEINFVEIIRFSSTAPLSAIMTPVSRIKRNDTQDNYLGAIKEIIAGWVNELNDSVIQQKKETDNLSKKIESICEKYNKAKKALEDDCNEAAGIPQYRSGFLGIGEGYKMNIDEYNKLINVLERICSTRVNVTVELFYEMMTVVREYSSTFDNHAKARRDWQLLNDSNERLIKVTKGLR